MFGLLRSDLVQGSAARTWNCFSKVTSYIFNKLIHQQKADMPRSRRRHHSRSRSRSRSHSHDKERDTKRRRLHSNDSHRRSVSPAKSENGEAVDLVTEVENVISGNVTPEMEARVTQDDSQIEDTATATVNKPEESSNEKANESVEKEASVDITPSRSNAKKLSDSETTPKRVLSPKQLQKQLDSQKKKEMKQKEKEDRERQRQEEREKQRLEKEEQRLKEKKEKEDQKKKEREEKEEQKRKEKEEKEEQKRKEKEEKEEQKRKEKEEKEEQKKKERELKEQKRQQEMDEKSRNKKKKDVLKEKESAKFVNFFVFKKSVPVENKKVEETGSKFMPFEVKTDMRLAPTTRFTLPVERKEALVSQIETQDKNASYLKDLKNGKLRGKSFRTWPFDEDVVLLEDNDIGMQLEQVSKAEKMKAKFLYFHDNRRPAYYGTWRKKSKSIRPRNPLGKDIVVFDYEVVSDEEWESEEENGESIKASDDEEKENDSGDELEENGFIVPHGYLSDEEVANEENVSLSPETQKMRLSFLQREFDEEMKHKTERIKPRVFGLFWEMKEGKVDESLKDFLAPRAMMVEEPVIIGDKPFLSGSNSMTPKRATPKKSKIPKEIMQDFIRLIHGSTKNQTALINEFLKFTSKKEFQVSKSTLLVKLKELACWMRCPDEGCMHMKHCWYTSADVREKYNISVSLPNAWKYED